MKQRAQWIEDPIDGKIDLDRKEVIMESLVTDVPLQSADSAASDGSVAVIYARVSSSGQLGRDGDVDGYSIPAQVEACTREAERRGASVVKVYYERAESARSDNRPVLQQMLAELPALGRGILIVHKVDRLARNRLDDAVLYERLMGMGITLVSASENIDATPAGRLMHGMLATFAEYYSNNLATEIKKGLHQKHKTGGTPFKPPIGYMPVRRIVEGREIRTIALDPEREQFVRLAFDLYRTGDWSLHRLAAHLEELGLRSRPTPKRGPSPIRATSLHKVLRNVYYTGIVAFAGARYPGRHEPLIDRETFDEVQLLLAAADRAGDHAWKHRHYLRGTLVCAHCGGRILFGRYRGKLGAYYEYFSCVNRASRRRGGKCGGSHYSVEEVERRVERLYASVRIPKRVRERITADVMRDVRERRDVAEHELERHARAIRDIEAEQEHLVGLHFKGLVSETVLARKQQQLDDDKLAAEKLQRRAGTHAEEIEANLRESLSMATDPETAYGTGTPVERRVLNQTFFKRIEIGDGGEITEAELSEIYARMRPWHLFGLPSAVKPAADDAAEDRGQDGTNPDPLSEDRGLHFNKMVEAGGIEPPTPPCKGGVFPLALRPRGSRES
jgi:site-specific DNA recombinase